MWNASGVFCTTAQELTDLAHSESALVLSKSCTLLAREGNPSPRYQAIPYGSINSMGLPNLGVDFYIQFAQHHALTKPYIISVAGLSFEENKTILQKIAASHSPQLTAIELNLSCPNVIGKPQVAYDVEATRQILDVAFSLVHTLKIGIKLPPYFDFVHFDEMAKLLSNYPLAFITAVNSIGNALFVNNQSESVVIKPKCGFGGLGGMYIKPTALANVRKWHEYFPTLPIIGCGGILHGTDVFEHLLCGATAVQVGTQLKEEGLTTFRRLILELQTIMQTKGYTNIDEYRGKLKTL